MGSLAIACVMFGVVLAGTLFAGWVAQRLPGHHLNGETRDVVKLGLGVIGTLAALVLGLLVASTKGTYDAQCATVKELAAQLAVLDRVLARIGPETADARRGTRALAEAVLNQLWPQDASQRIDFSGGPSRQAGEALFEAIAAVEPRNDTQRLLKNRAQDLVVGFGSMRQRLVVNGERSIPTPLLVLLVAWQSTLFAGFGLLAPRNLTATTVLLLCMISVSGAVFVVLELDRPFEGIVRVPSTPLHSVIAHLGN